MLNEQQILELLAKVGDKGITCKKLARHLYNANNSLFEAVSFDDIYRDLQAYLIKKSKHKHPYIEKTGKWGYYRLNKRRLKETMGWMVEEAEKDAPDEEKKETPDNYPSLFD